jgi:outer membrane receptor for ferrienterochelin and colicins
MALYGFLRHRNPFDANGDGYSEAPKIDNFTLGGRFYQRLGVRGKITADLYAINAARRGGNDFNLLLHEADIAEAVDHKIYSGSLTFERFFREIDQFSAYVSAQAVDRNSYYGAEKALDAYGSTSDLTYVTGVQYNSHFGKFNLVSGIENQGGFLKDKKLGYVEFLPETGTILHVPNSIVADQVTNTTGAFAQADYRWKIIKGSVGLRYDHYLIKDNYSETDDVVGNAISPRLNLLVDVLDHMQARLSYSQGYRAPQVFDEDLHIEASGARKVIHKNSADLKQESSHSFIASVDYHPHTTNCDMQFLVEAFCTRLIDPFSNEFGDMDETGTVVYSRVNADGYAQVFGANFELNLIVSDKLNVGSGFTVQRSEYSTPQEFNETKFFRTPDNYGFLTAQIIPTDNWRITLTENYTGEMLVPYFGTNTADIETGELRTSDIFFDTGIKICYEVRIKDLNMNIFTGVKNIFNSYQNDFDIGVNRDPAYVYGPIQPRTFYFGVKFGHYKA